MTTITDNLWVAFSMQVVDEDKRVNKKYLEISAPLFNFYFSLFSLMIHKYIHTYIIMDHIWEGGCLLTLEGWAACSSHHFYCNYLPSCLFVSQTLRFLRADYSSWHRVKLQ